MRYIPASLFGYSATNTACEGAAAWRHSGFGRDTRRQLRSARRPTVLRTRRLASFRDASLIVPTDRSAARPPFLPEVFSSNVERDAGAVAVSTAGSALSYGELDGRASVLAKRLTELGVGREDFVGVAASRTPAMVVALLGVIKSGAAYLPLSADLPPSRTEAMLADAGAKAIVVDPAFEGGVPEDRLSISVPDLPGPSFSSSVEGRDAAYLIYTSGSTGKPKGVVVDHRALANFLRWSSSYFELGPGDRVLQNAPLIFDASVWEIFAPLWTGAALYVLDEEARRSPPRLEEVLREEQITHLDLGPGVLRLVNPDSAPSLRYCMTGGDPVGCDVVERWARDGRKVINGYGPTEATDICIVHSCEAGEGGPPPIGLPITGMEAYVLDSDGGVEPPGGVGELYLSGIGLARGYLNRPEETAAAFLPDHLSGRPGSRLYRTGDLASKRADGVIEFLGRVDRQAKIAGHRVEPREIEAALLSHRQVVDAAVLVRDVGERHSLAAFVVGPVAGVALREWLEERLPAYMVPTILRMVPALPRGTTGKVDLAALRAGLEEGWVPLEGGSAAADLAIAFAEVAGVHLGGDVEGQSVRIDSLDAMRILGRLRMSYDTDLVVSDLLAPDLDWEELAGRLRQRSGADSQAGSSSDETFWPLPPPAARLAFMQEIEPASVDHNLGFMAELRGDLAPVCLRKALARVCERHRPLRAVVTYSDAGLAAEDLVRDPELAELSGASEKELRRDADRIVARPFNLASEAPLRAAVGSIDEERHLLALSIHHYAFDGWSLPVFLRDLGRWYDHFTAGEPAPTPLTASYASLAWQIFEEGESRFSRHDDYWKEILSRPGDSILGAGAGDRDGGGVIDPRPLPDHLLDRLDETCRAADATLFMGLLTGFARALSSYAGVDDLIVGCPVSGREDPRTEPLVGCFIEPLPVRLDLTADPSGLEMLKRVRESTMEAFAHKEVSFDRLVRLAGAAGTQSATPLFDVFFHLETPKIASGPWRSLGIEIDDLHGGGAVAPLTVRIALEKTQNVSYWEYQRKHFSSTAIADVQELFLAETAALANCGELSLR